MPSKLKYIMPTNHIWTQLVKNELIKPGLYQWRQMFQGDIVDYKTFPMEEYENYDVVHVNLSTNDLRIPLELNPLLAKSSTILLGNVDYSVELIGRQYPSLRLMIRSFKSFDLMIAGSPYQKNFLEYILKRPIPLIPHPCDTIRTKELARSKKERLPIILVCYHRYDGQRIIPALISSGIEGYASLVFGLSGQAARVPTQETIETFMMSSGYLDYDNYLSFLTRSYMAHEYYTITSHGRFPEECACLKVPVVCTAEVYNGTRYFPYTTFPKQEIRQMHDCLQQLADDPEFWDETVNYAWDAVEDSGWDSSAKKFITALSKVRK